MHVSIESVGAVLAIVGTIVGAAWKLSGRLAKIETELVNVAARLSRLEPAPVPLQVLRPKAKSRP